MRRSRLISGTPGAPGIAVGPAWHYRAAVPAAPAAGAGRGDGKSAKKPGTKEAVAAIETAVAGAVAQLESLAGSLSAAGRADEAGIFEAQALMASDPALLDAALARARGGETAELAVRAATETAASTIAALPDELLASRAADVRDVGARIVRILAGEDVAPPERPSIAVADDLPPSVAAAIPPGLLLGIAQESGSTTSHTVILARALGIPAVVGATGRVEASTDAITLAIDGEAGTVAVDPDLPQLAYLAERAKHLDSRRQAAAALRVRPAATSDGHRIVLLANIGGPDEASRALQAGAEGIGLFRTEFLYMKRQTAPSEDDQVEPYRRVFATFGPDRPVVIRLADIGGDKALPYLDLPAEANPAMGVRAIRLGATHSDLLAAQLRAIWRAAGLAGVIPRVMAPMVATLADVELLRELRDEARAAVAESGHPLPERMITGVMIEIPSAAILAAEIARRVDFFSIGTNDLTQYTLAADRSNPALAHLQDALHPAVLRLVAGVIEGAAGAGIPTAVCGELAGDPAGALVLAGLGITELSADAGSLDDVRAALAGVTKGQLDELGRRSLAAAGATAVRAMAGELLRPRAGTGRA